METEFKRCNCPIESWEVIIVDKNEQFEDRSTIYYHCDECGEDYAILDFYTDEILLCRVLGSNLQIANNN